MSIAARLKFASGGIFYGLFLIGVALNMYAATVMFSPCSVAYGQSTICNEGDQRIDDGGRVVNEDGGAAATDDFRVETDGNANAIDTDAAGDSVAFFQDASTNTVPFEIAGNSKITGDLEVTGAITGTGVSTIVFKSVDETVNTSSAFQDDDDLVQAVAANAYYTFQLYLTISTTTAADFKTQFTVPAGATITHWTFVSCDATGAFNQNEFTPDGVSSSFQYASSVVCANHIVGNIFTAGTAGNLQLQWAQTAATAVNTDVQEGSSMSMTRLD